MSVSARLAAPRGRARGVLVGGWAKAATRRLEGSSGWSWRVGRPKREGRAKGATLLDGEQCQAATR